MPQDGRGASRGKRGRVLPRPQGALHPTHSHLRGPVPGPPAAQAGHDPAGPSSPILLRPRLQSGPMAPPTPCSALFLSASAGRRSGRRGQISLRPSWICTQRQRAGTGSLCPPFFTPENPDSRKWQFKQLFPTAPQTTSPNCPPARLAPARPPSCRPAPCWREVAWGLQPEAGSGPGSPQEPGFCGPQPSPRPAPGS